MARGIHNERATGGTEQGEFGAERAAQLGGGLTDETTASPTNRSRSSMLTAEA
jgi:hypothetical protein